MISTHVYHIVSKRSLLVIGRVSIILLLPVFPPGHVQQDKLVHHLQQAGQLLHV